MRSTKSLGDVKGGESGDEVELHCSIRECRAQCPLLMAVSTFPITLDPCVSQYAAATYSPGSVLFPAVPSDNASQADMIASILVQSASVTVLCVSAMY